MKRFFYFSAGILCLMLATLIGFTLAPRTAEGDWDPSSNGIIIGGSDIGSPQTGGYVFTAEGDAYYFGPGGWNRSPTFDLPIPASQVKFMFLDAFITTDDVAYVWTGASWTSIGPIPVPVAFEEQSWGSIKRDFNKEK